MRASSSGGSGRSYLAASIFSMIVHWTILSFLRLDYHARVRTRSIPGVIFAVLLTCAPVMRAQEEPPGKTQPTYEDTFAGPIVELSASKVTVSRNVLGKTEKRTFLIKADTRIEGKLKVKEKVTVGFVTTDEGDIARLIVAHPNNRKK